LSFPKKIDQVRLKSLEIKGFKSFADKTVLHFDEGITGVIGQTVVVRVILSTVSAG